MQAKIITLLLALAVTAFPLPSIAKTLQGKAVHISDGDTLIVMDEQHRKYRVRLANIDCPEKRQPWGNKAKRALAGLVGNRLVRVEWGKTDRYGRLIGTVYHDNQNINRMLVADGHCWVYTRYNRDERLPDLQRQAQTARKGLWRLSEYDRCQPWRAKRRLVDPSSREAALFSRRALRQRENKVGLRTRRPVIGSQVRSSNELAKLLRSAW